jgi:hypothetical protein
MDIPRHFRLAILLLLPVIEGLNGGFSTLAEEPAAAEEAKRAEPLFHDSHFHLSNYVHEGIDTSRLLELMDDEVGRVALFGIPLMQKWDYFVNGRRRPGYYLESDAEMYYYSFIDALIARQ